MKDFIDQHEIEARELSDYLGFYSFDREKLDDPDENEEGNRTSVDGNWTPVEFGFDDDVEFDEDNDMEGFLGKRAKARRKKRKALRKSGVSRKEARKTARREVRQEMGRNKLGEFGQKVKKSKFGQLALKVGKGLKRAILVPSLAIPRGSYLALVGLNFRGFGSRIYRIFNDPNLIKRRNNLILIWKDLGGKPASLEKSAWNGNRKKAIMCGTKCRLKAIKYNKKPVAYKQTVKGGYGFSGADGENEYDTQRLMRDLSYTIEASKYDNYEPVHITIGAIVTSATAVISTIASTIKGVKQTKQNQEALNQQKKESDKQMSLLSTRQKKELQLAEKQMANQLDPKMQVLNNPNLSPSEKKMAIAQIDEAFGTKKKGMGKMLLYGGIALVGIIVVFVVGKKMMKK